ncbi:hypothetical protein C2W62_13730 [Candidatus Entotheonella serta]|nr:hypothetical protein C2W62_13730 [Candidatus Entotheonella serta]
MKSGRVDQRFESMAEVGELNDQSTRRHWGKLCPKCAFYRRASNEDKACDVYEKWLVDPPIKREECEYFISR